MSDKFHKALTAVAGVVFAVSGALLHAHAFPKLDWLWQVLLEVSGGGGLVALKPMVGAGKTEEPSDKVIPIKEDK